VVGDESGLYILDKFGCFSRVKNCNPLLLQYPPRVYVFGQKPTPHWVAANYLIGELTRQGLRVQNDCGPFYGLMNWFSIFDNQAIFPRNVVYIEPYNNKPKEELMAYIVKCLNQGLNENQFVMMTMSGDPVFVDGKFSKIPDGSYSGAGFIIAPTEESHRIVMNALKEAIAHVPAFSAPEADEKMQKLLQDLCSKK
jgi:hypothetical protein